MSPEQLEQLRARLVTLVGEDLAGAVLLTFLEGGGSPVVVTHHDGGGIRREMTIRLSDDGETLETTSTITLTPAPLVPLDAISRFMAQREGGEG